MSCERCRGVGWLEVDRRGQGTVQPCPLCNILQYERWASGAWSPKWFATSAQGQRVDPEAAKAQFDQLRSLLRRA